MAISASMFFFCLLSVLLALATPLVEPAAAAAVAALAAMAPCGAFYPVEVVSF